MRQILRMWWPIFAAMALIQAGNGLTSTLISVTSEARAFEPWLKGLVLSAFYAGSAAGAFVAPAAIARSTHVAALAGFILLAVAAMAGYALSAEPVLWIFLRLMAGFGLSGAFAAVESWLNLATKDDRRARVFSIYLMVQLGGLAAGQLFLNARGMGNEVLFRSRPY
jgi:MFS family permease